MLNPSFALGWYWSGLLRSFSGDPEDAIKHFEQYLRLCPRERYEAHQAGIGSAFFFLRRFDEAATMLRAALDRVPSHVMAHRLLASCYAHMGRFNQVGQIVDRLRTIAPTVLPRATPYRNPVHEGLFLSVLRRAAGETS